MDKALVENLNNRFDALGRGLEMDDESYMIAVGEYVDLISNNKKIATIFRDIIINDHTDVTVLEHIHFLSMMRNSIRAINSNDFKLPLYLDKAVETKYKLNKKFAEFMEQDIRRLEIAEKKGISILDVVIPEDKDIKGLTNKQEFQGIYIMHNRILEKLQKFTVDRACFNESKGELIVGDISIKIKKHSVGYETLRIIFENVSDAGKAWQFSEISELFDSSMIQPDKKFYNAVYQINQKMKQKNIDDLFITTRQSVQINPLYLS